MAGPVRYHGPSGPYKAGSATPPTPVICSYAHEINGVMHGFRTAVLSRKAKLKIVAIPSR